MYFVSLAQQGSDRATISPWGYLLFLADWPLADRPQFGTLYAHLGPLRHWGGQSLLTIFEIHTPQAKLDPSEVGPLSRFLGLNMPSCPPPKLAQGQTCHLGPSKFHKGGTAPPLNPNLRLLTPSQIWLCRKLQFRFILRTVPRCGAATLPLPIPPTPPSPPTPLLPPPPHAPPTRPRAVETPMSPAHGGRVARSGGGGELPVWHEGGNDPRKRH